MVKQPGKKTQGFTLIELMVVITVLAILVTVGVPSFTQSIKSNRLSATTNDLVSLINYARAESARRGVDVTITASNGSGSNEWGGGATVASGGADLRILESADASLTLDSANNTTAIIFSSTGLSNLAATETITVCDDRSGENGWQITMLVSGIIDLNRVACS